MENFNKRKVYNCCIVLVLLLSIFKECISAEKAYDVNLVKAFFIERFTKFVSWPNEQELIDSEKPFIIGVFGQHQFGNLLEIVYKKNSIKNKKVKLRYFDSIDELANCNLLFIGKLNKKKLLKVIDTIKKEPILTISDIPGFTQQGGHIFIYIEEERVRFEINMSAVKKAALSMSYLLLKQAKITNYIEGEVGS